MRERLRFPALCSLVLGSLLALTPTVASAQPSIGWLDFLVGVWDTEDTYHPATGKPTVERGVRTCALVMRESYLQCETLVDRGEGRGRTYRFIANYNATVKRFEMLSIWSNVPHKLVQSLTPDAARRTWRFENIAVVGDDEPLSANWSELVIESPERIVWTGRRITAGADPANAPLSFRETWTRQR